MLPLLEVPQGDGLGVPPGGALPARALPLALRGGVDLEYRTDSGYRVRFCSRCGSPLPAVLEAEDAVVLSAGSLDGDPGSRALRHIFVGSKAPWTEICAGFRASKSMRAEAGRVENLKERSVPFFRSVP